ncbi:hypothetical protein [Pedobacter chinensis]|uniref:hypothetical protein n=1 Tax=Pedobacter chinensis TaxID=2282421 RepID=UPI001313E455|nr:hypothetical protein [Pedobacter chinensis]
MKYSEILSGGMETARSRLLESGTDIWYIQQLLGYKSLASTKFTHITDVGKTK